MLLFRSEEHLERWHLEHGLDRGQTLTLEQQWELARNWYANRMDRDWRRRGPEEAEKVFGIVGLTGDFWRLTSSGQ